MEKSKKTLILTLILLLAGMFLISSVFASENNNSKNSQQSSSYKVVQTYKAYKNDKVEKVQLKPIQTSYLNKHEDRNCRDSRRFCYYERTERNWDNSIHYTKDSTENTRRGFLGDYVKEYSVDVKNTERTGKYFTVVFKFEDKDGQRFTQSVTQYLRTGESKKFVYKDLQYEKNEILDWDYTLVSQK
jgi:hypothetical protein